MRQQAILLVEDNRDDVELTLMAFARAHITNPVVVARDGVEALDYLFGRNAYASRDVHDQPVVVLLDLKLPRVSGLEVLERVRQDDRTKYIPVVVLTTSTELDDLHKASDLHANSYVRKPVDFDRFNELLQNLGRYWLEFNETPSRRRSA